ncbi:uncharacterized protein LOC123680878 [Harmonia axyridis]|uniref:uncharacterized protein LOC123680878 n=1 Tax=Harmonia axyridis TaxID=115357 RepID=UPI001E276129|nr:uncharacterized protein LOC123680878 [Harmonia axyridis]
MKASEPAPGVETAPGGRSLQSLAEASEASGTPLRTGTTRPRSLFRNTLGEGLDQSEVGDPARTLEHRRQRWTREMNQSLMNAYYLVTEGETKTKKYAANLAEKWESIYPDKRFTGKHLIAQIKNIKTRKLLSPDELETIKGDATSNSPRRRIDDIRRSIHRQSTNTWQGNINQSNDSDDQLTTVEMEPDEAMLEIRELFQGESQKWEGMMMENRPRIPKLRQSKDTRTIMVAINNALKEILNNSENFEELCHRVYCAAMMANNLQSSDSVSKSQKKPQQHKPPWEERLEQKINILRKEIGAFHAYLREKEASKKVKKKVQNYTKKLNMYESDPQYKDKVTTHLETLKQKISTLGSRLRRYHKRTQRYRQNNQFTSNQKSFFRDLQKQQNHQANLLSPRYEPEKFVRHWSKIWSEEKSHNSKANWIEGEKKEHYNLAEMPSIIVTEDEVTATIKRMKNWTAAGIDSVHNYWWKSLPSTHTALARLINEALENPNSIPKHFTHGVTYMIPKKGDPTIPDSYRPITCLPSAYKIITSTIGQKIRIHLKTNNLMAWEQNGCEKSGKGSKELLIIDNLITKQAKRKQKNISMAWIDYQKAFDSVPHSWLLEILRIYKVDPKIISFFQFLMSTWRTSLRLEGSSELNKSPAIMIKRGIFQGDSFSPLWFCLAMNPLSSMLNRSSYGYSLDAEKKLTHLFYIDDLKLYARGRQQLEGELELVRKFSEDIGMRFGLNKCATVSVKRGKLERVESILLTDGQALANLGAEQRYKYLGVQQTYEIRQRENKEEVEKELIKRVRTILNTQLTAKNKITALNIWAIPAFTYTAGILTWSRTDLERLDRKIRTTLTQFGLLHPNSAIERLYIPRRDAGRGLISLEDGYLKEEEKLKTYFVNKNLPVHQWVAAQRYSTATPGLNNEQEPERENMVEKWKDNWRTKPLHGRFYSSLHQIDVDLPSTNIYLTQGYLYPQTEGTLMAIQDQVVPTRVYARHIMKIDTETTKCRLCNNAEESVQHLSSGCSSIAGTKYLSRHNNMGKVVHQLLCLKERLLQGFTPLSKAYGEKITKYEALSRQMKSTYQLNNVKVKPLIISCNGLVHRKTVKHLLEMDLPHNTIAWMQKAVILGTVNIIRQVLFPH